MITGNDFAKYLHIKLFWSKSWSNGVKLPSWNIMRKLIQLIISLFKKAKKPYQASIQSNIQSMISDKVVVQLLSKKEEPRQVYELGNGTLIIQGDKRSWVPR
jgi:hypothetical protein